MDYLRLNVIYDATVGIEAVHKRRPQSGELSSRHFVDKGVLQMRTSALRTVWCKFF